MFQTHYPALVGSYLVALVGWGIASRILPRVWPRVSPEEFERPWKEFGLALLGAVGVLAVGQLWLAGIRFPERGTLGPIFGAINQVLIFASILAVPVLRRQSAATAWLPRPRIATRILTGLVLAALAVTTYSLLRAEAAPPWTMLEAIWRYESVDELVQVFLEDVTIAILFVRLASALGVRWSAVVVAGLFAAGHVPVMVAEGATPAELGSLLSDVGLGVAVILVLQRSRDVVWFWPIHFCLDMTQFTKVSGLG